MIVLRLIFPLMLSLAIVSSTPAQLPASAPAPTQVSAPETPEQQKAREELERKALALLDEIIGDAKVFRNPENRLVIKIAAADLLWPRNEARARTLFKEAANNLGEVASIADDSDTQAIPFINTPAELRKTLVQALARHDPQWARDVLRSTRPATPQGARGPSGRGDTELQLEQGISAQIAASDPKQALEVAEQTLSKGMTFELLNTISLLMRKDREAAARLASKIVTRLQTENLSNNDMLMQTAISFLRLVSRPSQTTQSKTDAATTATPLLTQQELRDLSELIVSGALSSSENSYAVMSLQPLLPEIEKYAPARLPQLRRKIEGAQRRAGRWGGMGTDLEEVMQRGTVEAMLEEAPKAPEEIRNYIYHRAAMKALEEGHADRAREIVTDNISEPTMRKYLMQEIERQQMMRAAAEGKMDQTRQMLARLRTNEERVMVLTQLALAASAKGEKKIALALLDEARSMVTNRARNFAQLGAQLQVARAYARLDAARGLSTLEPLIDQLNELIAAGALLGGFFSEQFVRDDEIQLGPVNGFIIMFANQYMADLHALASEDFERTKAAADRFQRDEVRTLARLLIVQSILSPRAPAVGVPGGIGILGGQPIVVMDEP